MQVYDVMRVRTMCTMQFVFGRGGGGNDDDVLYEHMVDNNSIYIMYIKCCYTADIYNTYRPLLRCSRGWFFPRSYFVRVIKLYYHVNSYILFIVSTPHSAVISTNRFRILPPLHTPVFYVTSEHYTILRLLKYWSIYIKR